MNHDIEFAAIRKIREMLFALTRARSDCGISPWPDGPNPFYSQTASGLFLQPYYGVPSHLFTPWGKHILGHVSWSTTGDAWDAVLAEILDRCGATLHTDPNIGQIGSIYALARVDDLVLPPAVLRPWDEYVGYDESKASWAEMGARP